MAKYVLITGFEAFGGRKRNLSEDLVSRLKFDYPVKKLILPVSALEAPKMVTDFVSKEGLPLWVLSLGEMGDNIRIETRVHNPDQRDKFLDLTLPLRRFLPLIEKEKALYSLSAGESICNDMAYRCCLFFKKFKVPFGFIHVPQYFDDEKVKKNQKRFKETLGVLRTGIKLLINDEISKKSKPVIPYTKNPISFKAAQKRLKRNLDSGKKDRSTLLETRFIKGLMEDYLKDEIKNPAVFLDSKPKVRTLRVLFKKRELPPGNKSEGGYWIYRKDLNGVIFHDLDFAGDDVESVQVVFEDQKK